MANNGAGALVGILVAGGLYMTIRENCQTDPAFLASEARKLAFQEIAQNIKACKDKSLLFDPQKPLPTYEAAVTDRTDFLACLEKAVPPQP